MGALALLLANVQFVLVGFGVTVIGSSELRNLSWGLALLAAGLLLPRAAKVAATLSE